MATTPLLPLALTLLYHTGTCQGTCEVTESAIEGPYYKAGAPYRENGVVCEIEKVRNGVQLMIKGRVQDLSCRGQEAVLDIWSADPAGVYSPETGPDYGCRGKVKTDCNGFYQALTIVPGRYGQGNHLRPAHVHFRVNRKGENGPVLTTQLYFEDDPFIKNDTCSFKACHAGDETITFPLLPAPDQSRLVQFNIVLGMETFFSD